MGLWILDPSSTLEASSNPPVAQGLERSPYKRYIVVQVHAGGPQVKRHLIKELRVPVMSPGTKIQVVPSHERTFNKV